MSEASPASAASPASPASAATLSPCKLKVIVLASWELLRNPSAEDLLRPMLIESVGPALDRALFSTAAATSERPAGLLNWHRATSVYRAETAPATNIGGGVAVRPVRSMFQTDTVALRLRDPEIRLH